VGLLLLAALALSACGSAAPAASVAAAEVAVEKLPDTVDARAVAAVKDRDDVLVLDVREPSEYDQGHIPGVTLIPMGQVADRLSEIPKDKTVIVTCRSGNRSGQITEYLRQQGYTDVHNMQGGIQAWQKAGLPVEQ
jgi:rhodanese-related sulfurtransferase